MNHGCFNSCFDVSQIFPFLFLDLISVFREITSLLTFSVEGELLLCVSYLSHRFFHSSGIQWFCISSWSNNWSSYNFLNFTLIKVITNQECQEYRMWLGTWRLDTQKYMYVCIAYTSVIKILWKTSSRS